jgi:L-amino acid N-acyltransferase YncA
MPVTVRPYTEKDLPAMTRIWNAVVEDGMAFPQTDPLSLQEAAAFFASQSLSAVAQDSEGAILGLYILHPNNLGRCGHIGNASYAVSRDNRGQGVGEALVRHCLASCRGVGFSLLQFNAVVASNKAALHLYEKLGFTQLGTIPGGFRDKTGAYQDIHLFYIQTP